MPPQLLSSRLSYQSVVSRPEIRERLSCRSLTNSAVIKQIVDASRTASRVVQTPQALPLILSIGVAFTIRPDAQSRCLIMTKRNAQRL